MHDEFKCNNTGIFRWAGKTPGSRSILHIIPLLCLTSGFDSTASTESVRRARCMWPATHLLSSTTRSLFIAAWSDLVASTRRRRRTLAKIASTSDSSRRNSRRSIRSHRGDATKRRPFTLCCLFVLRHVRGNNLTKVTSEGTNSPGAITENWGPRRCGLTVK